MRNLREKERETERETEMVASELHCFPFGGSAKVQELTKFKSARKGGQIGFRREFMGVDDCDDKYIF